MSWQSRLINPALRLIEKPQLARAKNPRALRRSFEFKARILFRPPRQVSVVDWLDDPGLDVMPRGASPDRTILYFHGGGYIFGSPRSHAGLAGQIAVRTGARVILPDYPLAPEHPFPAAFDHALQAYETLLQRVGSPEHIQIGGDSAGGGLALALNAWLAKENGPVPAGCFAFSPLTDLTYSGPSVTENAKIEAYLPAARVWDMARLYLNGADPTDPRASPLFAAFADAAPVWLTVGKTEILRDDSLRIAERIRSDGTSIDLLVEEDLPHVWPIFFSYLPEARSTLDALGQWITQHWQSPTES
ncbi:MAG: alpha/beta hydrolase [Pseudomonadota bacterium]